MKYIRQSAIILSVTCVGELLKYLIPLPIPASIYGLLLLFALLFFKVVRLDQVKEAGEFLIEIMPLMFIWEQMRGMVVPLCVIIPATTCLVMLVTGKVTDFMLKHKDS